MTILFKVLLFDFFRVKLRLTKAGSPFLFRCHRQKVSVHLPSAWAAPPAWLNILKRKREAQTPQEDIAGVYLHPFKMVPDFVLFPGASSAGFTPRQGSGNCFLCSRSGCWLYFFTPIILVVYIIIHFFYFFKFCVRQICVKYTVFIFLHMTGQKPPL